MQGLQAQPVLLALLGLQAQLVQIAQLQGRLGQPVQQAQQGLPVRLVQPVRMAQTVQWRDHQVQPAPLV